MKEKLKICLGCKYINVNHIATPDRTGYLGIVLTCDIGRYYEECVNDNGNIKSNIEYSKYGDNNE